MKTGPHSQGKTTQYPPKSHLISETWRSAFTLVELIIVITILAILATLAFMSFQGYMKDSRDAVRVSDLTSASKGLTIFFTKSGVYPDTESGITLTASGIPIGYQGSLWQSVARAINMNQVPLDPVDQTKYIYSTSAWKTKFQLMAYTENSNLISFLPQSYAIDYSERGLAFQWDELGVVLNNDNSLPTINVETASGTSNFKVLFDKTTKTEWSGNLLFSQIYNMRDDLINKKELASLDSSLVGYWDMETTFQSGGLTMLKDLSKYENHLTFVDGSWGNNYPTSVNWIDWQALRFKDYSYLRGLLSSSLTLSGDVTQSAWVDIQGFTELPLIIRSWQYAPMYYGMYCDSSYLRMHYYNGLIFPSYSKNYNYLNNQWYFISIVRKNNKILFYTNWVFLWETIWDQVSGTPSATDYISIGWHFNSDVHWIQWQRFDGYIDEVRIYNRALSDSEIKALYQATK